ncbi:MAG: hypothetical protein AAGH60_10885 [Pseudomonadota bacterium]
MTGLRAGLVASLLTLPLLVTLAPLGVAAADNAAQWCAWDDQSVWDASSIGQGDIARLTVDVRCDASEPVLVRAKIETRCGRALCSWGWSDEAALIEGRLLAIFQTFSAQRTVEISLQDDVVRLEVHNDFRREDRADEFLLTELGLRSSG